MSMFWILEPVNMFPYLAEETLQMWLRVCVEIIILHYLDEPSVTPRVLPWERQESQAEKVLWQWKQRLGKREDAMLPALKMEEAAMSQRNLGTLWLEKARNRFWPRAPRTKAALPTPWFQTSEILFFKQGTVLFIFKFIYLFIYLFLAVLGLCCSAQAFSSCGERGLLFLAVHGLLIAVVSLVAEHGL